MFYIVVSIVIKHGISPSQDYHMFFIRHVNLIMKLLYFTFVRCIQSLLQADIFCLLFVNIVVNWANAHDVIAVY